MYLILTMFHLLRWSSTRFSTLSFSSSALSSSRLVILVVWLVIDSQHLVCLILILLCTKQVRAFSLFVCRMSDIWDLKLKILPVSNLSYYPRKCNQLHDV